MSFTHNGSTVRVGLAPTIAGQPAQIPRTRVVARFRPRHPVSTGAGAVEPPGPATAPQGNAAGQARETEFDRDFVVQANDQEMARDFLGPAVRGAIANLQRGVHAGGMLVSINPERMLVQIDRNLGLNAEALALGGQEGPGTPRRTDRGGVADGSRKASPSSTNRAPGTRMTGPPICKVCGEPIAGGAVIVCAVCNTPHHRDCWEYVGACSIYGCNGKVGVRT